jgi:type IV pilus assembly protein PilC
MFDWLFNDNGYGYADFGSWVMSLLCIALKLVFVLLLIVAFLVSLAKLVLVTVLAYYFMSLPARRRDRARLFLDLLETAVQRGQPVETAVLEVAETRDGVMGVHFFIVAARVEGGLRLGEALAQTPRFLPPQMTSILRAGEAMGDLKRVLPACRETIRPSPPGMRSMGHYLAMLLLFFAPVSICLMRLLSEFVLPKFREVFAGMNVSLPFLTRAVFQYWPQMVLAEVVLFLVLVAGVVIFIGGPALVNRLQFRWFPVADWIGWRVPWKRKESQRTFSAMLAVMLDSGVPEAEAVRLAGEATANEICRRRAARVVAALGQGAKLQEAIRIFDDASEFHWRLRNGLHRQGGFLTALRGWHQSLDARAYQQQEAATQFFTCALIVFNGIVVGLVATGMFGALISILKKLV